MPLVIAAGQSEVLGGQQAAVDLPVHVGVHHHGDHRVGVPEPGGDCDHRHPQRQQPGGVRMPQVMKVQPAVLRPAPIKACLLERPQPDPAEVVGRQRAASAT